MKAISQRLAGFPEAQLAERGMHGWVNAGVLGVMGGTRRLTASRGLSMRVSAAMRLVYERASGEWPSEMRRLNRWGTLAGSPRLKQALMSVLKVSVLGSTPAMPMSLRVSSASCMTCEMLSFSAGVPCIQ